MAPTGKIVAIHMEDLVPVFRDNNHTTELRGWCTYLYEVPSLKPIQILKIPGTCDKRDLVGLKEDRFIRARRYDQFSTAGACFCPDGKLLVTGNLRNVFVWDVESGKLLRKLDVPDSEELQCCAFSSDGRTIVAWGWGWSNKVYFWETSTGRLRGTLRAPSRLFALAVSPDGQRLATAGRGPEVRIWELKDAFQRVESNESRAADVAKKAWQALASPSLDSHVNSLS